MARLTMRLIIAVAFAAVLAAAADVRADPLIVNCFEAARNIVQKTRRGDCRGTIVSESEAEEIRASRRDYLRRAYEERPASYGEGNRLKGIGTGFFVSKDGTLVTNGHVIRDCDVISVSTTDGRSAAARVLAGDNSKDLALLRVDLDPPGVARVLPRRTASGSVAMVGYPDQGIPPIKPLLTTGRALGIEQVSNGLRVLKIEADVRPGNSGGPLLDQQGNVVGVVFAEINTPKIYESTGKILRDIGYVIPSDTVIALLDRERIPYWRAGIDATASSDLLASARPYVVRVGCWK